MRWALLLLLLGAAVRAQNDNKVLRPCFERYPNNRLVNVRPFHSEWRMHSEDMCLRFCAMTSSRCRSIVFDSVQHICHFFLDEGQDVAVPAPRMIYLRVVSKQCLDTEGVIVEDTIEFPAKPIGVPTKTIVANPIGATVMTTTTTAAAPTEPPMQQAEMKETLSEPTEATEQSEFAGSFDSDLEPLDRNEVMRDINGFEDTKRWQSSMEQIRKDDEPVMLKKVLPAPIVKMETAKEVSRERTNDKKTELEDSLRSRLELLKEQYPTKFVEVVGEKEEREEEDTASEISAEVEAVTHKMKKTTSREKVRPHLRKIQFTEDMMFPKKASMGAEVRRKQPVPVRPTLKTVSLSAPSFAHKARSFLDTVNGDADLDLDTPPSTHAPFKSQVCSSDDSTVWLSFENSRLPEDINDVIEEDSPNKEHCRKRCQATKCTSFSFSSSSSRCQLSGPSTDFSLLQPIEDDFSETVSVKFCFAESLPIFHKCSSFLGFRDYALEVTPREQFEDLPKGYEGLQLCIELCVLSTDYKCKSASFLTSEGRCLLNADDSQTRPDELKQSLAEGHLYFENGCSHSDIDIDATADLSVTRVALPSKTSPLKALQIKPIKTNRISPVQKSSYQLKDDSEGELSNFFKRNRD